MERPVVRHYNLPVASYRDAVWPILSKPRRDLPCLWNGKSHPDAISHTIIGDVMAYGLIRAALASSTAAADTCAAHASQAPQRFHPHLELFQYCRVHDLQGSAGPEGGPSRGTFMSVYAPSTFQPVRSGSWLWREDVPGRPGECDVCKHACDVLCSRCLPMALARQGASQRCCSALNACNGLHCVQHQRNCLL